MKHILNTAKPGEVWAILLGDEYGYTRIFRGSCLGVIPAISHGGVADMKQVLTHARWFFGFAAPPTDKTPMTRIGIVAFPDEESAWPPRRYIPPDIFKGHYRIVEKGTMRPAQESEIKGLQKAQMATPEWLRQFILQHRSECALLKGVVQPTLEIGRETEDDPILLEVVFCNSDFSFKGRDDVEDSLVNALESAGIGEVTGGGSGPETCAIDVEVRDLVQGLNIIRQTLRRLGSPASTEIHQHQPQHVIHRL